MGLEQLREEIRHSAAREEKRLIAEAEKEAEAIMDSARREANRLVEQAREEAKAESGVETRKLSSAQLKARRIVGDAREAVMAKALKSTADELASAAREQGSDYRKFFARFEGKGVAEIGEGAVVYCRKQDSDLAQSHAPVKGFIDSSGGLVVESKDGRIRVDYTFESLLEERQDALKQKAYALLFGKRRAPQQGAGAPHAPPEGKAGAPSTARPTSGKDKPGGSPATAAKKKPASRSRPSQPGSKAGRKKK